MNIEEEIKKCEIYLKQIKQYDPDPFYVNYFFNKYINSINNIIYGIFEEANMDFGLFVTEEITQRKFSEKANEKKDTNALKFSEWFSIKYKKEHENPYPNFMNEICQFKNKNETLPEIKIRIRATERYKNDFNQEIKIGLKNGKIISKDQLNIEMKRQTQMFLEIINIKRNKKEEPKVTKEKITSSAFVNLEKDQNIEIMYLCQIYMPVIRRLIDEARDKIKELTN
ncbi:MAG: hypothetical protein ABR53_04185 [Nitrosopumilus sp. BACL13 MAG-121220-bin23]|jgi:hypothetical protein|nr:MAG: hypothetical protein ABR53_04185 [Nitrosopumilus sp. BACL13 MAG-121220-bin23]HIH99536.1 hypothetical protein [Nitrosopumilus sp.]